MVKVLRWICKKCDKKWIYPVERCAYCRGKTEKQIGAKTKVIGVSQVFIPSPYHPITPYHILILEDEHGNRMPKKTIKAYDIGDIYKDIPTNDEHAVSVVKIKYDAYEAMKEAIELIGGIRINPSAKILIKPGIIAKAYPYMAFNTTPKAMDALLKILIEKGANKENITVAEQSFFSTMGDLLPRSELMEVFEKYGVKFIDLSKTEFEKKKIGEFEIEISKEMLNKDLIINVPVMRTDLMLGISGALENMTRVVSKNSFLELQKEPIKAAQAIGLLTTALPKYITIADSTIGMESNAPKMGVPAFLNMIMASRDPVAIDKIFQEIGLLRKAEYIEAAGKMGIGETNIEKIKIVGNELKALQRELKPACGSKLLKDK